MLRMQYTGLRILLQAVVLLQLRGLFRQEVRPLNSKTSANNVPNPTFADQSSPPPLKIQSLSLPTKAGAPASGLGAIAPLRRAQIVNNSDHFNPHETKTIATYAKPDSSRTFLREALAHHYLFETLSVDDLNSIIDAMKPTFAENGETIIRQGDKGDLFYALESGRCSAYVDGQLVMNYEAGGCFGELALLYNSPRAASIIATTACKFWGLDLKTFRYILATTSSAAMLQRCEFLKRCSFLDALNNDQIGKLAGGLDLQSYADGELIVRQGDQATKFFVIQEGSVKCTQFKSSGREVDLMTLGAGDYFGEMALLLHETRHANCFAVGKTRCLTLDRVKFDSILGPVQDMLARRMRIRILQSVQILSRLPEAKLAKLASVMRVQAFSDGAYIIRQGEEGSRFYIINEGEVRCTRAAPNGHEEELIRLGPQEFFGERALITNEVRKANIIAVGAVECLVLERSSFTSLLNDVQDDIAGEMYKRQEDAERHSHSHASEKTARHEPARGPKTNYAFKDLHVMRTIGTGTFGRVKMVQHKPTGQVCALKCMNKHDVCESHQEKNIMNEKNLLFECSQSVFVLQLLQTYSTPNQIMMLMEFIQGGELWSYIYEKTNTVARNPLGGFEMSAVKFYIGNVIMAFKHVHDRGIAYRDLKPENLLVDHLGYVKMIDFGFAKKLPHNHKGQMVDKTYTLCGTPEYLAPEIVMSKGYDKSVDYWALGCLLYELLMGKTPFAADYTTKIFQNIVASEKVLRFPAGCDRLLADMVRRLLNPTSAVRLGNLHGGIGDLMKDPFLASYDWAALEARQIRSPYSPPVKDALDASHFDHYDEEIQPPTYHGNQALFEGF